MAAAPPAIVIVSLVVLEIPTSISIPVVVVIAPTSVTVPISGEVAAPFVTRGYPTGIGVCGAGPVTGVPLVVFFHRIPVALHPDKLGSGSRRQNPDNARGRRRANLDSDGYLGEGGCS